MMLDDRGWGTGPLRLHRFEGGHSNLTYGLEREGWRAVLRRPPAGPLLRGAHDVLREGRLLLALERSAIRAPKVLFACEDDAVLGAPFVLLEWVDGVTVNAALPEALLADDAGSQIMRETVGGLVAVHDVDLDATGLRRFARGEGYLQRQLSTLTRLWRQSANRELALFDRVERWLLRRTPVSRHTTLVHGDYRLGNLLFDAVPPVRTTATLDWEMATLGDPRADLGYLLATYAEAGDGDDPMLSLSPVTRRPGFPRREELIDRYSVARHDDLRFLDWFIAFALWKSAVFLEGSYSRYLHGRTDDPFFASLGVGVPALLERAAGYARLPAR